MTTTDHSEQLDVAPELRMVSYAFRRLFGEPPNRIGRVPGHVTLLASGPVELTVATPWGVMAAAGPRDDDVIELSRMQRPGERKRLKVADAAAGRGPSWTGNGLRAARSGARLLVNSELPAGAGIGAHAAAEAAIARCFGDRGTASPQERPGAACAMLGGRPLPFDLAAAGLRLVIIDIGVRVDARPALVEDSPMAAAAQALEDGDLIAVARLLNGAHEALACHDAQRDTVIAALRAGALGARATTDGPGRPVCAIVHASRVADVRAAVRACSAAGGRRPPRFLTFTAAPESRWVWSESPVESDATVAGEHREAS